MNPNQMGPQGPPQVNINIGLQDTKQIECPSCDGIFFKESTILRRVPAVLTGQKKDGLFPIMVFRCEQCGEVLKEFLPPGFTLEDDSVEESPKPKSNLII